MTAAPCLCGPARAPCPAHGALEADEHLILAGGLGTRVLRATARTQEAAAREAFWARAQVAGVEGAHVTVADPAGVTDARVWRAGAWRTERAMAVRPAALEVA